MDNISKNYLFSIKSILNENSISKIIEKDMLIIRSNPGMFSNFKFNFKMRKYFVDWEQFLKFKKMKIEKIKKMKIENILQLYFKSA